MGLITLANEKLKKMDVWDIAFTKFGMIFFGLLIAKLWLPALSLDWYWYLIVFLLCSIRPLMHAFGR